MKGKKETGGLDFEKRSALREFLLVTEGDGKDCRGEKNFAALKGEKSVAKRRGKKLPIAPLKRIKGIEY